MKTKAITILAVLGILALGNNGARASITIDLVNVGNAGNAADPLNSGSVPGIGAVSYDYTIGKYDVTIGQYTAFLNAVAATDAFGLYNTAMGTDLNVAGIARSGSSGSYTYSVMTNAGSSANRPITYVSWFDAARFSNWMANGQTTGAQVGTTTENGAYTLNGATSGVGFTKNLLNPNTAAAVNWWIPSENEWYKAAYYQPQAQGGDTDSYWLYPTKSNTAPDNTINGTANQANYSAGDYATTQSASYSASQNYLTDGGAFGGSASFYGTYDQGGNVFEWNDTVISGSSLGRRGGSWGNDGVYLQSSLRGAMGPTGENSGVGFRVAAVPEPSTMGLLALVGAGWIVWKRRKSTVA